MSRTYLELFFRHKYLLILPVLIAFTVATAFAFSAPRKYVASASVWTDTRVPAETTVGTTGGQSPPSAGQAALLTQLLATREFLRGVVASSPLADEFRQADRIGQSRILGDVAGSVYVSTPGPQLLSLVVTRENPQEVTAIASAILEQFKQAEVTEATARAKAQLEYDRRRLEAAQQLSESSGSRAVEDLYAEAAGAFNQSTLALAAVESSGMRVVDEPDVAEPQARRKAIAFGAAGGLLAGLTLSVIALVLLMVRDRSLRSEDQVVAAGFDLAGAVPADPRRRHRAQDQPVEEQVNL